jgi:hypothetical protein
MHVSRYCEEKHEFSNQFIIRIQLKQVHRTTSTLNELADPLSLQRMLGATGSLWSHISDHNLDTGFLVLLLVPLAVLIADCSSASFNWRAGLAADTGSRRPYNFLQKRYLCFVLGYLNDLTKNG